MGRDRDREPEAALRDPKSGSWGRTGDERRRVSSDAMVRGSTSVVAVIVAMAKTEKSSDEINTMRNGYQDKLKKRNPEETVREP